jgi:hypothetical protein
MMDAHAQTLQQIKEAQPESLWQFLSQVPGSFEAQIFYAFMIAGVIGIFGNYGAKWLYGEISGNPLLYLFIDYPKRTLLSYCTYLVFEASKIMAGIFFTDAHDFVGWGIVFAMGIPDGFACDALVNKGRKKIDDLQGPSGDPEMVQIIPGKKQGGSITVRIALFILGASLALAFLAPRQVHAQSANTTNLPVVLLASGVQNTTPVNTPDQTNVYWHGVTIVINVSAFTAGTYTPHLQGKDNVSGQYYDMLVGPAIGGTGTTVLRVYPGMSPIANQANGDVLPRTWRLQLVGATGQNMTLSVGAILVQ